MDLDTVCSACIVVYQAIAYAPPEQTLFIRGGWGGVRGVLRHPATQDEGTHPDPPLLYIFRGGGGEALSRG